MSVRLHIEQLVVEGLPLEAGEQRRLGDAVERELGLLLCDRAHPWPTTETAVHWASAPPLRMAPTPAPALGAAIAGSIHDSITKALGQ